MPLPYRYSMAGDLRYLCEPIFVGLVSDTFNDNLKAGILATLVFTAVLILSLAVRKAKSTL